MTYHHDFTRTFLSATKLGANSAYIGAVVETRRLDRPARRLRASWQLCRHSGKPVLVWSAAPIKPER